MHYNLQLQLYYALQRISLKHISDDNSNRKQKTWLLHELGDIIFIKIGLSLQKYSKNTKEFRFYETVYINNL